MIMNPALIATAEKTYTPSAASLEAAEDMVQPVSTRDYPPIFKILICLNTLAWVLYFMGEIK